MSDAMEIMNLLSDEQYESSIHDYTDSQLEYITDYNNSSYSSGSIFFDTQPCLSKWVVWKDAFLQIPVNITSSGTAYSAASLAAWKSSVLSFISGVIIATSSGQTIVSDSNISIINNLRLLIEKEFEWDLEESHLLMFSKDFLTTPSSTTMGGTACTNTSTTNGGFLSRIQKLKQQASGTTTWSMVLSIPLRYVHDFFDKLDFPMINNRFQLTFQVQAYSNTVLSPFTVDSVGPVPPPVITIGPASSNGLMLSNCRLYYRSVKFQPSLNQRLVEKLNSGYTKKVFYRVTDTYTPSAGETNVTTGSINRLVSASTVHPLRVWLLAPPTGGLSTAGSDTVNGTFTFPGAFTNANIMINNANYYQNSLNTVAEFWTILEDQFPGAGSRVVKVA